MPFAKGMKKIEGSGIKKGQKTIASFERGYLLKYLKEEGADRFLAALGEMEDDKFVDKYLALIEFAFPKLARTETKVEVVDKRVLLD